MIGSRRIGVKQLKIAIGIFNDKFVILDNTLINIVVPYNIVSIFGYLVDVLFKVLFRMDIMLVNVTKQFRTPAYFIVSDLWIFFGLSVKYHLYLPQAKGIFPLNACICKHLVKRHFLILVLDAVFEFLQTVPVTQL